MSNAANGAGLMAATIAICGFLAHAWPAISGKDEAELRRATAVGGLSGCATALLLIVLSGVLG